MRLDVTGDSKTGKEMKRGAEDTNHNGPVTKKRAMGPEKSTVPQSGQDKALLHLTHDELLLWLRGLQKVSSLGTLSDPKVDGKAICKLNTRHVVRLGLSREDAARVCNAVQRRIESDSEPHLHAASAPVHLTCPVSTVAVVGTAGRGAAAGSMTRCMTRNLFNAMVSQCEETIVHHLNLQPSRVRLVSGGAAWAGTMQVTAAVLSCADQLHCCA